MNRIALPNTHGFQMVNTNQIIRCEADSNYTNIFLNCGKKIVVTRQLKALENALPEAHFIRVHHSHIINLEYVEQYKRNGKNLLFLSNGDQVEVSRSRKHELMERVRLV